MSHTQTETAPDPEPGELLPCPFCGCSEILLRDFAGWEAMCSNCYAEVGHEASNGNAEHRNAVIAAWNRRTPPQTTGEWVLVPREPTDAMRAAANDVDSAVDADERGLAYLWSSDLFMDVYRRMIAAAQTPPPQPAQAMGEWRGIESAPKDREIMLGSLPSTYEGKPVAARCSEGYWSDQDFWPENAEPFKPFWFSADGGFTEENPPTHWQEKPKPPRINE